MIYHSKNVAVTSRSRPCFYIFRYMFIKLDLIINFYVLFLHRFCSFCFVIVNCQFVFNISIVFTHYYSLKLVKISNHAFIFKSVYSWFWIFFKRLTKTRQIIASCSNCIIICKIMQIWVLCRSMSRIKTWMVLFPFV